MSGCAVHEGGFETALETPAAFPDPPEQAGEPVEMPDRWWTAFDDPDLFALQEEALAGNFDLAIFRDRLRAARAVVERERSFLFPAVDYSLFGEQTRRQGDDFRGEERFGGSLLGTYEVDVWRRNASIVENAALNRAATRERLKAAAIALTADVGRTWYALVEQRGQARVLDDQIETNETVLKVLRTRFGGGVVRASDVLRQERLLESTREQRVVAQSRIDVLEHALLVLTGRPPTGSLASSADELPSVPPMPRLGLPSELVGRRPDLRAALLNIRAADAAIAAAVADKYPSVTLALDASTMEEQIGDLFDNWFTVISVDVLGPVFDAGRREAEVRRSEAVKAERVNAYAQTLLIAFREVVDAVARETARIEQIARLERQLELAQRTSERLNREYLNGDISYIDVLDALTLEQQLQRDLLAARFARISDRIDLYGALAGGWEGIVPDETSRDGAVAATEENGT
jgi:NodT family efflux transporter outer membrane factor (OMF) lipoprotein